MESPYRPDEFFSEKQQLRLEELMACWREARDAGGQISDPEQSELQELVEKELQASAHRAANRIIRNP